MQRIRPLDPADAPTKSRALLEDIAGRTGGVGDMVATMAHSPALLSGYLDLSRAMKRIKLPRALSEKISIALQVWIGCERCLAAHEEGGRAAGLTDDDLELARRGLSADGRETPLIALAMTVLADPSSVGDAEVDELRAYGWSDRVITEIVGLAALNLLTGSFNQLTGISGRAVEAPD